MTKSSLLLNKADVCVHEILSNLLCVAFKFRKCLTAYENERNHSKTVWSAFNFQQIYQENNAVSVNVKTCNTLI